MTSQCNAIHKQSIDVIIAFTSTQTGIQSIEGFNNLKLTPICFHQQDHFNLANLQ